MGILILVLIVYGISAIVTISKMFEPLRDLAEKYSPNFWKPLTSCMQCFPFWAGVIVVVVMGNPIEVKNVYFSNYVIVFFEYLFAGALFSGTTFLIHTVFVYLKGEKWDERMQKERARKIKKGVIQE